MTTPLTKEQAQAAVTKKDILCRIQDCMNAIAKERDKLRSLVDEADAVLDSTDEALGSLELAVDTLSQCL